MVALEGKTSDPNVETRWVMRATTIIEKEKINQKGIRLILFAKIFFVPKILLFDLTLVLVLMVMMKVLPLVQPVVKTLAMETKMGTFVFFWNTTHNGFR